MRGCTTGNVAFLLRSLRKDGLADVSNPGNAAVWSTPERIAAYRAERESSRAVRRRRSEERRREREYADIDDPILQPRQVRVTAWLPAPPRVPNSVFQLAAMAA